MKDMHYIFQLKKIYLGAGKSVMDRLFSSLSPYIRYSNLSDICKRISISPYKNNISINDCFGAFFHKLCCILSNKLYSEDIIYYILSPYHNSDVIYQMMIPDKNSQFTNQFSHSVCKATKLYAIKNISKYYKYIQLATEMFSKAEKIQQETL